MKSRAQGPFRRLVVVFGTVALVGAAACAAQVDEQPSRVEVKAEEQRRHKSPVTVVIEAARSHGDLRVEQARIIDDIAAEMEEGSESRRVLRDRLRVSAVDVVRAGTADSKAFDEAVDEAMDAIEAHIALRSDMAEEIHALLDADQRSAVADALHAYIDRKRGPKPQRRERKSEGLSGFVAQLALSTLQVDQLMAIKKELVGDGQRLRPSSDELHAIVDAFEGDDFRAALDALHADKAELLRAHVARASDRTDTVLAIFTPEQRDLLADLILEGPTKLLYGEEAPGR